MVDYTDQRHYPELINAENKAIALFSAVMKRQINLIVNWMRVSFIHGVMNTDNMSISGESIDYGPCAFMDHYDTKRFLVPLIIMVVTLMEANLLLANGI